MNKKEQLVNILRQDARLANKQIAAMMSISEQEVAKLISELEESGLIIGYTAIINEEEFENMKG